MHDGKKIWESVNEIFARFSYVSPQLRGYITTKEFRKSFMFDGQRLTKNTTKYNIIGPSYAPWNTQVYPWGMSNIDGEFPDPFYRADNDLKCPKVEHTIFNCFGNCRDDNCNENPPKPDDISVDDYIPNIFSMPLHKFITADLKDFLDPFEGQLGYDTTTREGAVRTKKGTYKYYKYNQTLVRSELTRVSKWTGLGIWDGIGVDPYRKMHYEFGNTYLQFFKYF